MSEVLALPAPAGRLVERLAAARAEVTAAAEPPTGTLDDDGLARAVREAARLRSQVDALQLRLAGEAERRRAEEAEGDAGTDAWLARLTGERREVLRGGLRLARLLRERYAATAEALGAGLVRLEQARTIVNGLELSADDATPEQQREAEERLLAKATGSATRSGLPLPPSGLRRAVRHAYDAIDGDLARRHLLRSVRRNRQVGETNTWLTLHDNGDGTYGGRFSLPELHGQMLRTALETLSAPRRTGRDRAGATIADDSAGTETAGLGWCDRLGLAFCELIEHLPADRLARSVATIMATIPLADLRADLAAAGVAVTTGGMEVEAGEARRLACEAGLVPAVLGGRSEPLDLGRTRRLHSEKQRQALALRHDSCAIASCDRPFAWCEIHHPTPWASGGPTDLANALPLCWHHHRAAHGDRFELVRHDEVEWVLRRRRQRC